MCTAGMAAGGPVFPPFWVPAACTPAAPQSSSMRSALLSRPALSTTSYCPLRRFSVIQPSTFIAILSFFIQTLSIFDFSRTRAHLFQFSTTTRAATALQTQLAHPPPIPWPCATTTTLPQSTPSQLFAVSPIKQACFRKILMFFFQFLCTGPALTTPAPPAHSARAPAPPAHPSAHLRAHLRTLPRLLCTCTHLAHLLCTIAHLFAHICTPSCTFALPLHTFRAHPCTFVHPCAPFHAHSHTSALPLHTFRTPSMHPCALCAPSSGFVTLI